MLAPLSISTVWASAKSDSASQLLDRMAESGLTCYEVDFRIIPAVAAGLPAELKTRQRRVSSLHNFCPVPAEVPRQKASGDLFNLAGDREQRDLAVRYTTRTMELAADLEAKAVVLHAGWTNGRFEKALLEKSVAAGHTLPDLAEFMEYRGGLSGKAVDSVSFVLDRLATRAEKLGLALGLENRFHPHEVPSLDEAAALLERFEGGPVGFWFDLGHAMVHEYAGLLPAREWLDRLGERLVGCHLHDISANTIDDHQLPGRGSLDWGYWCGLLKDAPLKVAEIKPGPLAEELAESMEFLAGELDKAAGE